MGEGMPPVGGTGVRADDLPARSTTLWRFRRRRLADLGTWPFRVGICATLAVLTGVASLQVRGALGPPDWLVIGLVALAVLPWLIDVLVAIPPPWVFAPLVIVPVALLHDPSQFDDPLPFLLAILALDMGLQLGLLRSAVIVLVGAAVVTAQTLGAADAPARALPRVLVGITGAWMIGLALHSQVRRVARLRRAHRDLDERVRDRLEAVRTELAAVWAQLDRGEEAGLREHLGAAERQTAELLRDLDGRANGGSPLQESSPPPMSSQASDRLP